MFHRFTSAADLEFLTWSEPGGRDLETSVDAAYSAIGSLLADERSVVLHERVFAAADAANRIQEIRRRSLTQCGILLPVAPTVISGASVGNPPFSGIHMIAARFPLEVEPVRWNGLQVGQQVTCRGTSYLALSDVGRVLAKGTHDHAKTETSALFSTLEALLTDAGWSFHEVRRTWFYLRDILDWYDTFNSVRNAAFKRLGIFGGEMIPASTGIFGRGLSGCWTTLDLLATRAANGAPHVPRRLENPRQNEAPEYGSTFARGLELGSGPDRTVMVSGTASIDDNGRSVHLEQFEAQVEHTFATVEALLAQADCHLGHLTQATAFVKRPEDVPIYRRLVEHMGLEELPQVVLVADVCRPELLFEIDACAAPQTNK